MNRIFKTVFSRSRGAMMVANELTKSHQVGKKAAVAVAVTGALVFGAGSAAAGSFSAKGVEMTLEQTDVASYTSEDDIVGGWDAKRDSSFSAFDQSGKNTHLTLNTNATFTEIVGGFLMTQYNYTDPKTYKLGNTYLEVANTTANENVIGGSKGSLAFGDITTNSTTLVLKDGAKTIAETNASYDYLLNHLVVSGDLMKCRYQNENKDLLGSGYDLSSTIGTTNLIIQGGSFDSMVVGGSVIYDHEYDVENNGQADGRLYSKVGTANTTINGGSFTRPIFGGSIAIGFVTKVTETEELHTKTGKAVAIVDDINMIIKPENDSTISFGENADIYAGGAYNVYSSTMEDGTEISDSHVTGGKVTVTGGEVTVTGRAKVSITNANIHDFFGATAKLNLHEPNSYYKVEEKNYIATDLTLENVKANTVVLGQDGNTAKTNRDSTLTIVSSNTVNTLTFENGKITGNNGTLKLTTGNFGSGVTLDGTLTLNGGLASSTANISVVGDVTIKNNQTFGGKVSVDTKGVYNYDASDVVASTIFMNGGTVQGTSTKLFTPTKGSVFIAKDHTKVDATAATSALTFTTSSKGTIALLDEGYYTNESLSAMTSLLMGDISLSIANASLYKEADEEAELKDGFVQETENAVVKPTLPASSTDKSASVTVKNTGAQTVVIDDTPASSTATAPVIEKLEIKADTNTNFVLVGDQKNSPLLSLKSGSELKEVVFADTVTVQIGSDNQTEQTGGTLPKTTVKNMNVSNVKVAFDELRTKGEVSIGNNDNRGVVTTPTIKVESGSKIFLAPIWVDGATMADASQLEVTNGLDSTIDGSIIVGRNSVMTYGATVAQAQQGLDGLGLKWGEEDVSAALYIGHTLDLGTTGGVYVDGSLYQRDDLFLPTVTGGTVNLAGGSLLMINAATVGEQAVEGNLTVAEKATVAVVNAADNKFVLSDNAIDGFKVLSDNQFVDASYDKTTKTVITDVNEQKLAGAVASLGIVQMARRADTVMANTIADRTAQTIAGEGVSLWADVGGERYEADKLANQAQYKANMFYGAFGADVGLNPNARIGAAVQYGTGDSKSDNYNIKNDIDAVSLGLYGTYNFNENMKVVGEFAYTMSSNDVTSSERLLKNDIDADAFSFGFRGQHDFKVGAFNIVPSLGVRVTRICTDDFNVGGVKVDLDSQTLVQIPLSVAFSADIAQAGWTMKPYAKVSFTPSFGDDEINVRGYKQDALDTMPVQGDFGLSATNGNVTFGASLSAGFGQDGAQSFGGKVGIRYAF